MISKNKFWFFEKINENNKPLTRLIKQKREDPNKLRNEREVTMDFIDLSNIFSDISVVKGNKRKTHKENYTKVKNQMHSKGTIKKKKKPQRDSLMNRKRYLPMIYPINSQYPKFIKNSYNSTPKNPTPIKK